MIQRIETKDTGLAVAWKAGGESRFPFLWLRDNCRCPRCRDPRNGQRLFDALDLPAEPTPAAASLEGEDVAISWAGEGHESRYAAGWLAAHDLSPAGRGKRRPELRLWGAEIANDLPRADWPAVLADPAVELRLLRDLERYGFALLHQVPVEKGQVAAVGDRLGHVRVTNYGRLFDVVSLPNPNNLAFTAVGLGVHTDNPYRDPTPGLQLLHCLESDAPGGRDDAGGRLPRGGGIAPAPSRGFRGAGPPAALLPLRRCQCGSAGRPPRSSRRISKAMSPRSISTTAP